MRKLLSTLICLLFLGLSPLSVPLKSSAADARPVPSASLSVLLADIHPSSENSLSRAPEILEIESGFNWRKDWWKYAIILLIFCVASLLLIKLARALFVFLLILACTVLSYFGAQALSPHMLPLVNLLFPNGTLQHATPEQLACVLAFLACFLCSSILLYVIRRCYGPLPQKKADKQ